MRCLPAGVLAVLALAALAAPRVTLAQVGPQSAKETWDIFFKSVGARQRIDKLAQQMGVSAERLLGGPLNKFQSVLNPPWLSPALQRKVNRAMDDSYEKVIEILRQLIETMAEPLKIEKILLDRNDPLVQVKGYLKDVSIEQLSTFDVKDLEINLYNVSAAIKVDFEKIDAHGKYDVDGTASGQLHVFGQGDFHIRMYQPAIEVDIQLDYDSEHFKISTLNVYVRMAKLKLILENFLGGGEVGDLVCGIASDVGPAALDEYREEVNHLISSNIVETANALLATVPIDKIIDWITGGGAGDQSEQRAGH